MITALLIGAGALWLISRKHNSVSGIGAARKRRIYKELSLAQQAGVDFTKPYDELTEDEIESLQRVSNETGYTETYYKSLQKAYNAISGIGEAYDVVDADGNTVLTWIEDPQTQPSAQHSAYDDPERYRALREAHDIENDRMWAEQERKRKMDETEARLAEQRRKLKKAGRSSQMALFGIGYPGARKPYWYGIPSVQFISHGEWSDPEIKYRGRYYNAAVAENECYAIWREQLEYGETALDFEKWMQTVGGDYLKSDVLPYM